MSELSTATDGPHLLFVQTEQPLRCEVSPAHLALKLPLRPILVEDIALVARPLTLVLQVAVACGVGAVTVTAAETVGKLLVTVAVNVTLQE